jgi:hypothetical protein
LLFGSPAFSSAWIWFCLVVDGAIEPGAAWFEISAGSAPSATFACAAASAAGSSPAAGAAVGDHVCAILRVRNAGEGHLGARRVFARRCEPRIERIEGPGAGDRLERRCIIEAGDMTVRLADRGIEVRTDQRRAALVDRVAGSALLEHVGALGDICRGEARGDRRDSGRAALARLLDAFDRIAHLFGAFRVEHHPAHDRQAQCGNAARQCPARNRIEPIVHHTPLKESRSPFRLRFLLSQAGVAAGNAHG